MKAKGKREMNWNEFFTEKPCDDAVAWLDEGGFTSLGEAWPVCPPRADWMIWAWCHRNDGHALNPQQRVAISIRLVRETPLGGGRTVYDLLEDERSIEAIEVAERFVVGKATEEELRIAADAAARAVSVAGRAVYYAADAARDAADAAAYTDAPADAAYSAVYSAVYTDAPADAAYSAVQKAQADIVREWWPTWTPEDESEG